MKTMMPYLMLALVGVCLVARLVSMLKMTLPTF